MKPWDDRKKKEAQVDGLLQSSNGFFFTQIPEAFVFAFNAPEIFGLGTTSGLEMNLQDRGVGNYGKFAAIAQQFAQELNKTGDVQGVNTDYPCPTRSSSYL